MDERLKRMMGEFNAAVNDWLSESKEIAQVMAKIEAKGYDVFLVVNVTKKQEQEPPPQLAPTRSTVKSGFTARDIDFLRSMHISGGK